MTSEVIALPTSSFTAPPQDAGWQQLNIALARVNGDAVPSARAMFQALEPLLQQWRAAGHLHWWFFMRKPPDVRLRLFLRADRVDAQATLEPVLQSLQSSGLISGYFRGNYRPESTRFGGSSAMELVHAYFHVDTVLWHHLDALDIRSQRTLAVERLLPAVFHHLFQCCCGTGLALDGWRALAMLIRRDGVAIDPLPPRQPAPLVSLDAAPAERGVLQPYTEANQLFSQGLLRLASEGSLHPPVAQVAATLALFNLNRHGLSGERSAPLTAQVLAALGDHGQQG